MYSPNTKQTRGSQGKTHKICLLTDYPRLSAKDWFQDIPQYLTARLKPGADAGFFSIHGTDEHHGKAQYNSNLQR
jgi:hypothetical protein